MTNLPSWEVYGDYSSKNYGAHALVFSLPDGREVWFSYKTPVAFRGRDGKRYVRVNDWSTTTGKHLNAIDRGDKKARISGAEFERLIAAEFGEAMAVAA